MKIQIRKSIEIFKKQNIMRFNFTNDGISKTYETSNEIDYLITLLNGKYNSKEIYNLLNKKFPNISIDDFNLILNQMIKDNIIEQNNENLFNDSYYKKYKRQINFFEQFSNFNTNKYELQNKLRNSKVAIFGLGGTGSWIIQSLVLSGIQNFRLFDFDIVELTNLNRQVLYEYSDIGKPKLDSIYKKIKKINPDINVELVDFKIEKDNIKDSYISDCDLVINCTDFPSTFKTSLWISKKCMKFNIPHIIGGGYHSNISVIGPTIIPFKTPCWKCYELANSDLNDYGNLIKEKDNEFFGNIGVISAITANLQAWDAIRVLIGETPLNIGKKGFFDFNTYTIEWSIFEKNKKCPWCSNWRNENE